MLWLTMRRIDEVGMCRAEVSGELVQSVVSNKDTTLSPNSVPPDGADETVFFK